MEPLGTELTDSKAEDILSIIRSNAYVFAWKHNDMARIDSRMAHHLLRKHKGCTPMKHKLGRSHLERRVVVKAKVEKVLVTGFI